MLAVEIVSLKMGRYLNNSMIAYLVFLVGNEGSTQTFQLYMISGFDENDTKNYLPFWKTVH